MIANPISETQNLFLYLEQAANDAKSKKNSVHFIDRLNINKEIEDLNEKRRRRKRQKVLRFKAIKWKTTIFLLMVMVKCFHWLKYNKKKTKKNNKISFSMKTWKTKKFKLKKG